jgi:hypothetical protein
MSDVMLSFEVGRAFPIRVIEWKFAIPDERHLVRRLADDTFGCDE